MVVGENTNNGSGLIPSPSPGGEGNFTPIKYELNKGFFTTFFISVKSVLSFSIRDPICEILLIH